MLANFERISKFLINIEAREDNCNRTVHEVRFLRGYVGDSQNLWQQARAKLGLEGLDFELRDSNRGTERLGQRQSLGGNSLPGF